MKSIILILSLILCSQIHAQSEPDTAQVNTWAAFNRSYDSKWTIKWDGKTGSVASLFGHKTKKYDEATLEKAAEKFFSENGRLFKIKSTTEDLSFVRKSKTETTFIDFQQMYKGVPIFGGQYTVEIDDEKAIRMVGGRFYDKVDVNVTPKISADEAIRIAIQSIQLNKKDIGETKVILLILPSPFMRLTYRVDLNHWECIIDANDGMLINKYQRICSIYSKDDIDDHSQLPKTDQLNGIVEQTMVSDHGHGYIFEKDPYNSIFSTETLYFAAFYRELNDGWTTKVSNSEIGSAIADSAGNFFYVPPASYSEHDDTHFDDVNVFYHVQKYAWNYWPSALYVPPFKANAYVHDGRYGHHFAGADLTIGADFAGDMIFGHGDGPVYDLSKKDDVIYHEYTHLVSGQIGLGYFIPNSNPLMLLVETAALNEGYSDYHAASFTNDPIIGEWVSKSYPNIRTLATTPSIWNFWNLVNLSYPGIGATDNRYKLSMVWSGALWDIRSAIGSDITNKLVLRGLLYKHGPETTFLEAREGLLMADQAMYGGVHVTTIESLLNARGIGAPQPLSVTISGPDCLSPSTSGTWYAEVSGGGEVINYEWRKNEQVIGTASSVTTSESNFTLELVVTSSGLTASDEIFITQCEGLPGGCPFVFSITDQGMEIDNNILHRSEFIDNKNKDIQDLYKMNVVPTKTDNRYHLQIKELNSDHSFFDNFSFYAIDHAPTDEVGVTEDNRIVKYIKSEIEKADEIIFEDGEIISNGFDEVEGVKGEIMHVKFSQEKINRLKSALAKSLTGSIELALQINFKTLYPSLPPKERAFYLDTENQSLSKTMVNSVQFARRERNAPVLVPISLDMPLDDIIIHWSRDFAFGQISLVPVYEISTEKQTLSLRSAFHSHDGNVTSKVSRKDHQYANLDSMETIDLTFDGLDDPVNGMTRAFVLETIGRYSIPRDQASNVTSEFSLAQNYPNPFNPSTTIRYTLTENTKVILKIYNMLGQEVRTLVDKVETSGIKDVTWDAKDSFGKQVASGVYIYKLNAGKTVVSRKMIFVK